MTGEIFAALEMRFNANQALITTGRQLLQGFDDKRKNVVRPYTEVKIEKDALSLSTFESDIDRWNLQFRYHAKDLRTMAADLWLGGMRAMFKDGNLSNYAFHCAGVNEGVVTAPTQRDSAYDAAIRFVMTIQWRVNSPLLRYA